MRNRNAGGAAQGRPTRLNALVSKALSIGGAMAIALAVIAPLQAAPLSVSPLPLLAASAPMSETNAQFVIAGPTGSGFFGADIVVLGNGNFVVADPNFSEGGVNNKGAVSLYNGATFALIARMTGTTVDEHVGSGGIVATAAGDYVVATPNFDTGVPNVGAVTWCDGATGCAGVVDEARSVVGATAGDMVGSAGVTALENGAYLVRSPKWTNGAEGGAGAVTFCPPAGCLGMVAGAANSLVGSSASDAVGENAPVPYGQASYLITAPYWDNGGIVDAGAVTFCFGNDAKCRGPISASISLVGSFNFDYLGNLAPVVLPSGGYVALGPIVDIPGRNDAGFARYCEPPGCTGDVTAVNSLVGMHASDRMGSGGVHEVGEGNYVVISPYMDYGATDSAGGVTFCQSSAPCTGSADPGRSLTGTKTNDMVGSGGVTVLTDGSYVVSSPAWSSAIAGVGASTWCSGETGCTDMLVAEANSLRGAMNDDRIGSGATTALADGTYAIGSPSIDNGVVQNVGAITWCPAGGCAIGVVSMANSLFGGAIGEQLSVVKPLPNGDYVVSSPLYNLAFQLDAGKVVLCPGESGCGGTIETWPGLVGNHPNQQTGSDVTVLENGNFVVRSQWNNAAATNAGALTLCSAASGCPAAVDATNSLVGSTTDDALGAQGILAVEGSRFIFKSENFHAAVPAAGAFSLAKGDLMPSGELTNANSIFGSIAGAGPSLFYAWNPLFDYLIVGLPSESKVVVLAPDYTLQVTAEGNGVGTVVSDVEGIDCGVACSAQFNAGTVVTLTATSETSSTFEGWSGACTGMGACIVTMSQIRQVTANFVRKSYDVTVTTSTLGGSAAVVIEAAPPAAIDSAALSTVYLHGTVLRLTATAEAGWVFERWGGIAAAVDNPHLHNVTGQAAIYPVFRLADALPGGIYLPNVQK